MKKLFRPLLLLPILTVTSAALIGCGGGSSPSRPASQTRADLTFSNVKSPSPFNPILVTKVLRYKTPPIEDPTDSGVYIYRLPQLSGAEDLNTRIISNQNGEYISLSFQRSGDGVESPTVGTVYDLATAFGGEFAVNIAPSGERTVYISNEGTITVTARSGSVVTYTLANVRFESESVTDDQEFTVSGTVTFDLKNKQVIKLDLPTKKAR